MSQELAKPVYGYEIEPRPIALGGGYRLVLLQDGEEAGGGVFLADAHAEPMKGMAWFNNLSEAERAEWLGKVGTGRAVDAYALFLEQEAHLDAQEEGEAWLALWR